MLREKLNRIKEKSSLEVVLDNIHEYAYLETFTIISLYLSFGYFLDSEDICMLNGEMSYILILLAIITLFHGFENGIFAVVIFAIAIWFFYPVFQYVAFLSILLMTMIFSEFHYYWTQKIKSAELNANYRGDKLDELSRAFYSLKISHDQLEKNYVIKPMSIRHSIEYIIERNKEILEDDAFIDKKREYYRSFLELLAKSFNVNSSAIIYKHNDENVEYINEQNSEIIRSSTLDDISLEMILKDYLVDEAISRNIAIFISDKLGEPTVSSSTNSDFLAVIPAIHNGKAVAVLVIKKMPFMSFNREILTSISILLEYFTVEIRKKDILHLLNEVDIVKDETFCFEYSRLKSLYKKYNVNSIVLALRVRNELQAMRIYEINQKLLRSLDLVAMVEVRGVFYICLMFPLHDKATALGYLNRLLHNIDEERDKNFHSMTFTLSQTKLFNNYLREDVGE